MIRCDAKAANAALRDMAERHEALVCYLFEAIKEAVAKHNTEEIGHGLPPAAPLEIRLALAEALLRHLRIVDASDLEQFVEELRIMADDDGWQQL